MRKICSVVLVSACLAIANSNACFAQGEPEHKTSKRLMSKLMQAQEKSEVVQVALKNGEMRWGRPIVISAAGFSLSSPAADGSNLIVSFRYDQVLSLRYETGRSRLIRWLKDIVTLPIVLPVFTIWWIQGYRC